MGEGNSERNYNLNPTEEDNRLFILILVASFIIISMIIIIGSTACILLCFEESIEEKEEELQEKLLKFTEKKKKKKTNTATAATAATAASCSTTTKRPSTKHQAKARINPSSENLHQIEHHITLENEEEPHLVGHKDEEQARPLLNRALSVIPASDNNNGMRRPEKQGNPLTDF